MLTAEQRKRKQRLIRMVIALCLLLIPALAYLQRGLLGADLNLPVSSTILIFALININGLLLLLMLYLVLRNLVELIFERNQKIMGSQLRTRLVISFVSLTLVPTGLLFVIALRFVSTSMDYWFNTNVDEALEAAHRLAQSTLHEAGQQAEFAGRQLVVLMENGTLDIRDLGGLERILARSLEIDLPGAPDSLVLLDNQRRELIAVRGQRLLPIMLPVIPSEAIRLADVYNRTEVVTQRTTIGELIQAIVPVDIQVSSQPQTWFLVTTLLIPTSRLKTLQAEIGRASCRERV